MENFIVETKKCLFTDNPNGEVVRLSKDAYNKIVEVSNKTGVAKKHLVSQSVEFALRHIEYKEVE